MNTERNKALASAQKALEIAIQHMNCDEHGNGPDCTPIIQAQIDIAAALAASPVAQPQDEREDGKCEHCGGDDVSLVNVTAGDGCEDKVKWCEDCNFTSAATVQPQEQPEGWRELAQEALTAMDKAKKLLKVAGFVMEDGTISAPYNEVSEKLRAMLAAAPVETVQPAKPEVASLLKAIDGLMDFDPHHSGNGMVRGGKYVLKSEVIEALTRCATSKEASFDKARMEETLAQPQIPVPEGLSREELRSFIISHSSKEASEASCRVCNGTRTIESTCGGKFECYGCRDDGNCRSCVNGKCTTGKECVAIEDGINNESSQPTEDAKKRHAADWAHFLRKAVAEVRQSSGTFVRLWDYEAALIANHLDAAAQAAQPVAQPCRDDVMASRKLYFAANNLLAACLEADKREELPISIDGSLLDALTQAMADTEVAERALRTQQAQQTEPSVPAQAVTLTDEDITEMAYHLGMYDIQDGGRMSGDTINEFARDIERRLLAGSAKTGEAE